MSLLFMDGFDDDLCNAGYKGYIGQSPTGSDISTTYGRFSTKGARIGDITNDYLDRATGSTNDTIILGFGGYIANLSNADVFVRLLDSGIVQIQFRLYDDGSISAFRSSTLLGNSGPNKFLEDVWQYWEIKVKIANTGGTVDVRVNGVSILSLSSQDTQQSANAYVTNWQVAGGSGYIEEFWIDDLVVMDGSGSSPYNNFLGDIHVELILPDGNGNSSGMSGSDGNSTDNYLLVDDNPVVTTDYVEATTEGTKDTYAMENLSAATTASVYGIQVALVEQKDDSNAKYMRPVIRRSSTDYVGTSISLSTSWAGDMQIWEQDPSTAANWTVTNINGLEVGQEVRDS